MKKITLDYVSCKNKTLHFVVGHTWFLGNLRTHGITHPRLLFFHFMRKMLPTTLVM